MFRHFSAGDGGSNCNTHLVQCACVSSNCFLIVIPFTWTVATPLPLMWRQLWLNYEQGCPSIGGIGGSIDHNLNPNDAANLISEVKASSYIFSPI